jgi:hypothetical protein
MNFRKTLVIAALALLATGTAFAANSLVVNAGAALNNTNFGLQVNVDGSTNNVYVESDHPNAETHYVARFFLCPNDLALQANRSIRIGAVGDATLGQHIVLFLRRDIAPATQADQWLFNTWISQSDGNPTTFIFGTSIFLTLNGAGAEDCSTTSSAHRWLEIEYTAGTGADGQLAARRLVYNGSTLVEKFVNNRSTANLHVDNIRIGALAGSGGFATAASSYYFDEFESYR